MISIFARGDGTGTRSEPARRAARRARGFPARGVAPTARLPWAFDATAVVLTAATEPSEAEPVREAVLAGCWACTWVAGRETARWAGARDAGLEACPPPDAGVLPGERRGAVLDARVGCAGCPGCAGAAAASAAWGQSVPSLIL